MAGAPPATARRNLRLMTGKMFGEDCRIAAKDNIALGIGVINSC